MIEIPFLTYTIICDKAIEELRKYGYDKKIPIQVEQLTEIQYGIQLKPVRGLHDISIDSFISISKMLITVDYDLWDRYINRYRFSLAHEIGHLILHADILSEYPCSNINEYIEYIKALNGGPYERLEDQANTFAGCLLMPPAHLSVDILSALQMVKGYKFHSAELLGAVARYLADRYEVSPEAMQIQIIKSGLSKKMK